MTEVFIKVDAEYSRWFKFYEQAFTQVWGTDKSRWPDYAGLLISELSKNAVYTVNRVVGRVNVLGVEND